MKKRLILATAFGLAAAGAAQAGTCNDPWVTRAIQQVTGHAPTGYGNSGDCNIQNYGQGHWNSYDDLLGKVRAAQPQAHVSAPAPMPQAGVCTDPWVTQAVRQVMGRAPNGSANSGECAIQNYGQGHWSDYNDLVAKVRARLQPPQAGVCTDPWVTQAVRQVMGRAPNGSGNSGECAIQNYGQGHWSDYNDLVAKVRNALQPHVAAVPAPSLPTLPAPGLIGNGNGVIAAGGGNVIAAGGGNMVNQNGNGVIAAGGGNVIAAGGGNMVNHSGNGVIAAGGANVIAAGGGNVIAPGGANVIAAGGGNVIAAGGGNLVNPNAAGVIAAGGGNVIAAGGANMHYSVQSVESHAPQRPAANRWASAQRPAGGGFAAPQVYSEQAVEFAEGLYRTKRYPEAEQALTCAGFHNVAPTRPSRTVVPGKAYEVVPNAAVKHAAEVDLPARGNTAAALCGYLRQPSVHQWYVQNYHLM